MSSFLPGISILLRLPEWGSVPNCREGGGGSNLHFRIICAARESVRCRPVELSHLLPRQLEVYDLIDS